MKNLLLKKIQLKFTGSEDVYLSVKISGLPIFYPIFIFFPYLAYFIR